MSNNRSNYRNSTNTTTSSRSTRQQTQNYSNYSSNQEMSRSRSSHRNDYSNRFNNNNYQRPQSYDRSFKNKSVKNDDDILDDYVDCKAILDNKKQRNQETRSNKELNNNNNKKTNLDDKRNVNSPMKRNNDDRCLDENAMVIESPKKRIRATHNGSSNTKEVLSASTVNVRRFMARNESPKRSHSLCEPSQTKKSFASTPKSERRCQASRVKELMEQNSIAVERNLSNNWADIIEELEEQSRELDSYVEKVITKYKLDKEKLRKNIETDTETLRKRQKKINFGKVTAEYQRYILAMPKKQRKPYHPKTPNKFRKCSRRKFDGLIKKWRKLLHVWDENPELLPEMKNSIDEVDEDITDDFGGASNITSSDKLSYNLDDYDILDSDSDENKLVIEDAI